MRLLDKYGICCSLCCLLCVALFHSRFISLYFPFPWFLVSLFSSIISFHVSSSSRSSPPCSLLSLLIPPFSLPIASLLFPLFLTSVSSHPISRLLIFKDSHCSFTPSMFTLVTAVFGVRSLILLSILFVHHYIILSLRCSSFCYAGVFFSVASHH